MKILTASNAQTPEALLIDLRALLSDAELMLNEPPGESRAEGFTTLRARFTAREERLADFYRTARSRLIAGARQADRVIRANPYRSLAIALSADLLVGVRLGRCSR